MALRVTRQIVEVLGSLPVILDETAENTLTASDSVGLQVVRDLSAANTLAVDQGLGVTTNYYDADSSLTLTDEASSQKVITLGAASTIELSQSDQTGRPINLSAGSGLNLTQNDQTARPINVIADNAVQEVVEEFDPELLLYVDVIQGLDTVAAYTISAPLSAGPQFLQLTQSVFLQHLKADLIDLSAENTLALTQEARQSTPLSATSILALAHSATAALSSQFATSSLSLDQTAGVTIDRALTAVSTLAIKQGLTYSLLRSRTRFDYSPFIGENSDPNAPTPPDALLPCPLENQPYFRLVYPASGSVTSALTIRAPNLGNRDRLAFDRVNRESRGGTLIIFADPIWPKIQTLVLSFSGLKRVEAMALLDFMLEHLGEEIGMIDWEGRFWRGVIVDPDEPVVQDSKERFTASFQFEGELSDWTEQEIPLNSECPPISPSQTPTFSPSPTCCTPFSTNVTGVIAGASSAQTDSDVIIGTPIYLKAGGNVDKAQANNAATKQVIGLCVQNALSGHSVQYFTEGKIERADWTPIVGTPFLTRGALYYLNWETPGLLTGIAPTTSGNYVVAVGRAVTATTLDIEIQPSIKL